MSSHTSTNLLAAQAAEYEDPCHSLSGPVYLLDILSSQDIITESSLPVSSHTSNNLLATQVPGHSVSQPVDLTDIHSSQDVIAENSLPVSSHTSINLLAAQSAEDKDPSHFLSRPVVLPGIHSSQDVITESSLPISSTNFSPLPPPTNLTGSQDYITEETTRSLFHMTCMLPSQDSTPESHLTLSPFSLSSASAPQDTTSSTGIQSGHSHFH